MSTQCVYIHIIMVDHFQTWGRQNILLFMMSPKYSNAEVIHMTEVAFPDNILHSIYKGHTNREYVACMDTPCGIQSLCFEKEVCISSMCI
jgi:hypothetical protein